MSPIQPDLVDVWIFRTRADRPPTAGEPIEILLLRRAKDDAILPGLWQGVSGGLDDGENAGAAALRELAEETGFGPHQIECFYHLDQVNQFLEPGLAGVVTAAVFAVRVAPGAEPVLSGELDAMRWVSPEEALEVAVWPDYRESIRRILENLLDPERAAWFELKLNGERVRP